VVVFAVNEMAVQFPALHATTSFALMMATTDANSRLSFVTPARSRSARRKNALVFSSASRAVGTAIILAMSASRLARPKARLSNVSDVRIITVTGPSAAKCTRTARRLVQRPRWA